MSIQIFTTSISISNITTTSKPSVTNSTNLLPDLSIRQSASPSYYCECDLTQNICDINCCCDIDCSNSILEIFYCTKNITKFNNYLDLLPCDISEGWFCIFKDNSKEHFCQIFDPNKKQTYEWPNAFIEEPKQYDRIYYKTNDPILLFDEEKKEISELEIPYSLTSTGCNILDSVRYLQNVNRECLTTWEKRHEFINGLLQKFEYSKILVSNNLRQNSIKPSDTINTQIYICINKINKNTCKKYGNDSIDDEFKEIQFYSGIEISFLHNFTNLLECNVYVASMDFKNNDFNVWQEIIVEFKMLNEIILIQSGNLGYDFRKPIIQITFTNLNETIKKSKEQIIIDYFNSNRTKYEYIQIPGTIAGNCVQDFSEIINFGENSITKCFIQLKNETILHSEVNFTEICLELQTDSYQFLLGRNFPSKSELFISEFGSPKNISRNWIKLENENDSFESILGRYIEESDSFICENMIINVQYNIFIVKISVNGINNQNLVKRALLKFGTKVNLEFNLDSDIKIPLQTSVMFFDSTSVSSGSDIKYLIISRKNYYLFNYFYTIIFTYIALVSFEQFSFRLIFFST